MSVVKEEWEAFLFRHCNGVSNGIDLGCKYGNGFVALTALGIADISQQKTEAIYNTGNVKIKN